MEAICIIRLYLITLATISFLRLGVAVKYTDCDASGYGCLHFTNCRKDEWLPYKGCSGSSVCCKKSALSKCKYKGGVCVSVAVKYTECDASGYGGLTHTNCPKTDYLPYKGCSGFSVCCKKSALSKAIYKGGRLCERVQGIRTPIWEMRLEEKVLH
ncbi:hypothetical protein MTO96_022444 [Rhipicephalus appendiculatus]